MKNIRFVLTFTIAVCIACALNAAPNNDQHKNTISKAENMSSDFAVKAVQMPFIPDYLLSYYYDADDLYLPKIVCFDSNIDKAGHVIVTKCLYDRSEWERLIGEKRYYSYSGTFLDRYNENIEKMCNVVPLIKQTVK